MTRKYTLSAKIKYILVLYVYPREIRSKVLKWTSRCWTVICKSPAKENGFPRNPPTAGNLLLLSTSFFQGFNGSFQLIGLWWYVVMICNKGLSNTLLQTDKQCRALSMVYQIHGFSSNVSDEIFTPHLHDCKSRRHFHRMIRSLNPTTCLHQFTLN